jgi:hypothetical protein
MRTLGSSLLAVAVLGVVAGGAAEASHTTDNPQRHKIVYHLNEP